ncbi:MAG: class I SAM-dependent methyltransferase [Pirellula sp.]
MSSTDESFHVVKLPREPFLSHSLALWEYLLGDFVNVSPKVLELGCGPQSPLLPWVQSRWPETRLHQIDAQPQVVSEAMKWNPRGFVEQMFLTDLSSIANRSKDLVIAMSVFDQNPVANSKQVASEIHRVLADSGRFVYIHNEELNLPATADSFSQRSRLLLPSPNWLPQNDIDYCSGSKHDIETALSSGRPELAALAWYLHGIYPQLYGEVIAQKETGKVTVPFLRDCSAQAMEKIRESVRFLSEVLRVELNHHRTSSLLQELIENQIFSPDNGFEIVESGTYEIRHAFAWNEVFQDRPIANYFVRGLTRFGFASPCAQAPIHHYRQELNSNPPIDVDEKMFVAYQYGLTARKR